MTYVLIVSILSCAGMVALALFKPAIRIKGISLGTYWMITLLGAVLLLAAGTISFSEAFAGLTSDSAINPLKILVLFVSMTVLSIFLDETGFFKYLANTVLKRAGGSQVKLFTAFYLTVSVLTVFTSNDIIILTFTPFICYFAKNAKINPIPYLVSEFVAANTASMLFIIGNPTNIYLATAAGIGFVDYLKVMALPTLFAVIAAYIVMRILFRKHLKTPLEGTSDEIAIEQKALLVIGLVLLSACTVILIISSYINIEMWLVAGLSAAVLTVSVLLFSVFKHKAPKELARTYRRAPWELVPFVISMFVIILTLEKHGVTESLAAFLGESNAIIVYGTTSVLFANLVNNIPMSVFFSATLQNLSQGTILPAMYAVVIGSNIGAFLTPIGALAGIMWLSILKNNGINFNFIQFLKYGAIIVLPVLAAALGGLMIASVWI